MMTGSFIKKSVSIVLSASLILGCAGIADIQAKKAARLSASRLNMETGEKTKIKIKNKSKKAVYLFKSSNKKTASVNKKGTVTAKKQGKATITVKEKIKKSTKKIGKVKITVTTPKQDNIVVQTNIPGCYAVSVSNTKRCCYCYSYGSCTDTYKRADYISFIT